MKACTVDGVKTAMFVLIYVLFSDVDKVCFRCMKSFTMGCISKKHASLSQLFCLRNLFAFNTKYKFFTLHLLLLCPIITIGRQLLCIQEFSITTVIRESTCVCCVCVNIYSSSKHCAAFNEYNISILVLQLILSSVTLSKICL